MEKKTNYLNHTLVDLLEEGYTSDQIFAAMADARRQLASKKVEEELAKDKAGIKIAIAHYFDKKHGKEAANTPLSKEVEKAIDTILDEKDWWLATSKMLVTSEKKSTPKLNNLDELIDYVLTEKYNK